MTINAPAALLLLLYELVAEGQGVPPGKLRGTAQNDILKEYIARGNYIFPPRPSMRLTTDLFAYCAERLPSWNTISISGYHIREAGSTAARPGSRSRSTSRPSSATTRITSAPPARSGAPASRSIRSPTWNCCSGGFRWKTFRRR